MYVCISVCMYIYIYVCVCVFACLSIVLRVCVWTQFLGWQAVGVADDVAARGALK